MEIKDIDKNFDTSFTAPEDLEWFSALEEPFRIYGIYYSEEEGRYRRVPAEIADNTNTGVLRLARHTAGGRVRFQTDSPYIAVRMEEPYEAPSPHITMAAKYGATLFVNGKYAGTYMPTYDHMKKADPTLQGDRLIVFDGMKNTGAVPGTPRQADLFLPLYSPMKRIYIGLKKGCIRQEPKPYRHERPILFYGSSITQGGCACKSGDDYISRLSRMLDTDIINLGFSGSAKGETIMAEYIARQDASVFVLDYDHNAPSAEHLAETHFPMYEAIRKLHPDTPVIMMTRPAFEGHENKLWLKPRREVILQSYERAREAGDENVYFVDCYGCYGADENGECGTVDGIHPDSLGFLRMAERVYPVLNAILNGEK